MQAITKHAKVTPVKDLIPNLAKFYLREGTIPSIAPSWTTMKLKLPKPHKGLAAKWSTNKVIETD